MVFGSWLLLAHLIWICYCPAGRGSPHPAISDAPPPMKTRNVTFYIYPTADAGSTEDTGALLPSRPLTLVFHGFKGDHTAKSVVSIKEALLLNGVQNVVLVDWSALADSINRTALPAYYEVRDQGVTTAARRVVRWLRRTMNQRYIVPEDVHLIGFSLGAHLSGIIGRNFNSTIGRITGLDPPKFGYEVVSLDRRLDATDAMFVDVIHTSAGILTYTEAIGHVDFLPNGEAMPQKGCPVENPIHFITCSHYFAFTVFAETVFNKDAFVARECGSWLSYTLGLCRSKPKASMGYHMPNTTRGMYFTKTKDKFPFGNEDPDNPVPGELRSLLIYNKSEGIISSRDVVNFLDLKSSSERSADDLTADFDSLWSSEGPQDRTGVMKVKNSRPTSTTADPPAFQFSSSSSFSTAGPLSVLVLCLCLTRTLLVCNG